MTTAALAKVAWPQRGHLHSRREPAESVIAAFGNKERGLREIVFGGQSLHRGIGREVRHRHDGRWITREYLCGEGVYFEDWSTHVLCG